MTMRVLVTGASGLIGRKVVELLKGSHEAIALVRTEASAPASAEVVAVDLTDPTFVKKLPQRADAIIHLAQASGFANFPHDARSVFSVNVRALTELLGWAAGAGVRSFVHASTGGLYGRGPIPFREDDPTNINGPLAFYYGTKSAAELLAKPYGKLFNVVALRYFFVYGPGQRDTMLFPRLVKSVASGQPITLAGTHGMALNPIYVDDAATATIAALQLDQSTVVNIAGRETLSLRGIAEIIGERVDAAPVFQPSHEADGNNLMADTARMQSLLHTPRVGMREGIDRLVAQVEPVAR